LSEQKRYRLFAADNIHGVSLDRSHSIAARIVLDLRKPEGFH
jgi:hypothetical protein